MSERDRHREGINGDFREQSVPGDDVITAQDSERVRRGVLKTFSQIRSAMLNLTIPYQLTQSDQPFDKTADSRVMRTVLTGAASPLIALAAFAHLSSALPRYANRYADLGLSLPDGLDKVSDVAGPFYEPVVYTHAIKETVNSGISTINKRLRSRHKREIFYHDSLTKRELMTAISWYGGLWITSEIAALGSLRPPIGQVADLSDIPAYVVGLVAQYKYGKEVIKRFPPGRFADMERGVGIMLQKKKKKGEFGGDVTVSALLASFEDRASRDQAARSFLSDYKKICFAVKSELLKRTKDIHGYIKNDAELEQAYQDLIRNYTFVLSRKWFVDQLGELGKQVPESVLERHTAELEQKQFTTRTLAKRYRRSVT